MPGARGRLDPRAPWPGVRAREPEEIGRIHRYGVLQTADVVMRKLAALDELAAAVDDYEAAVAHIVAHGCGVVLLAAVSLGGLRVLRLKNRLEAFR